MYIEGDSCAFARGNSQVSGHTAVVPPSVGVDGLDGQVATRGHPLPVWKHLLMMAGRETLMKDYRQNTVSIKTVHECVCLLCLGECGLYFRLTVVLAAPSTGRPSLSHSIIEGGLAPRDTQLRL